MVIINQLNIDVLAENIVVDVATTPGNVFTSILIWTSDTFQVLSEAIDVSSYIVGTDETEAFSIPASALGLTKLSGLFFIEFTTDEEVEECCPDTNKRLAIVSNFIKYHECILNNLLSAEIDDCGLKCGGCDDCEDCSNKIVSTNLYLQGLYIAIQQGFYQEAIDIIKILDELCEVCHSCPDYGNAILLAGGGFGIYNNALTLL
jgi:hypothetical protein